MVGLKRLPGDRALDASFLRDFRKAKPEHAGVQDIDIIRKLYDLLYNDGSLWSRGDFIRGIDAILTGKAPEVAAG